MITGVKIFMDLDLEEEELRPVIADFCDVLAARGLATDPSAQEAASIVIVHKYEVAPEEAEGFLMDEIQDAFLLVVPVKPQETDDSSSDSESGRKDPDS